MTSEELMPILKANKLETKLPLLCAVHAISFEGASALRVGQSLDFYGVLRSETHRLLISFK